MKSVSLPEPREHTLSLLHCTCDGVDRRGEAGLPCRLALAKRTVSAALSADLLTVVVRFLTGADANCAKQAVEVLSDITIVLDSKVRSATLPLPLVTDNVRAVCCLKHDKSLAMQGTCAL